MQETGVLHLSHKKCDRQSATNLQLTHAVPELQCSAADSNGTQPAPQLPQCKSCCTWNHSPCCTNSLRLHIILTLLFIKLALLLSGCVLVLLVFGDKIVHVALSLSELHLVHTLSGVP